MPKFTARPLTVNAQEYQSKTLNGLPPGVKLGNLGVGHTEAYVITERGMLPVHDGDWVVEEIDGTYYPLSRELFIKKFEPYGGIQ